MKTDITFYDFKRNNDCYPVEITETLNQFIERFNEPYIKGYRLEYFLTLNKKEQNKLKNGPCFSLATFGSFVENTSIRNDKNVLYLSGIGIDVDNKDPSNILTVKETKKIFKNYFYILHSTHSSRSDQPRFRIILLFNEPVTPERYVDVTEYFDLLLEHKNDPATKDLSRVFYYPSCPSDQADNYFCYVNEDKQFFDTSVVPIATHTTKKQSTKKQKESLKHSVCPSFKKIDLQKIKKIDVDLKLLIKNGYTENRFKSRSEYVFYCVAQLFKKNIKLEDIFCIIADSDNKVSERYDTKERAWADICNIVAKLDEKKFHYGVITGIDPLYDKPNYQEPNNISKLIHKDIVEYTADVNNNTYSLGIKAPAGIGKTEAIIQHAVKLVKENNAYIEIYLPRHNLAVELKERIVEYAKKDFNIDIAVEIILGRNAKYRPDNHCIKSTSTAAVSQAGSSVSSLLCHNKDNTEFCAEYNNCNYWKQFHKKQSITIYTHKHLFLQRNHYEKQKKPTLIIIDESFFVSALSSIEFDDKVIESLSLPKALIQALDKKLPYNYLLKNFEDPATLVEEQLSKYKSKQYNILKSIAPNTLPDTVKKKITEANKYRNDIALLKTMKADFERIENGQEPIFLFRHEYKDKDQNVLVKWYCVQEHQKLERLKWIEDDESVSTLPTICIDADLDPIIANEFFTHLKFKEYYAKRNATIWQVITVTNAKRNIFNDTSEENIKYLLKQINNICKKFKSKNDQKNVVLITYQELLDHLKDDLPNNVTTHYFGNLRGIDMLKNCDACIVIGRNQIPYDAVDRYGIGLWHDSEEQLKLGDNIYQEAGYRTTNGNKVGTYVSFPVDKRLMAIAKQVRECETLQAIDRLRLMFNNVSKRIFILSSVPLDIDIDQVILPDRSETIINKIMSKTKDYVITFHVPTLYRHYKEYFKSKSATKKIVDRWKDIHVNENGAVMLFSKEYRLRKYSYNKNGGNSPFCLHKVTTSDEKIIAYLQKAHAYMGDELGTIKLFS